jgi:superfamily II DNA or RNA helicase
MINRDGVRGQLLAESDGQRTLVVHGERSPAEVIADQIVSTPGGKPLSDSDQYERQRRRVRWLRPTPTEVQHLRLEEWDEICSGVLVSWIDQFSFRNEHQNEQGEVISGFRPPQMGALHAVLAHWAVSDEAATVVMPTGTGKTETMLALFTQQRMRRLLVVVPTVALRGQTVDKFVSLGLLKPFGVLGSGALYPVVGALARVLTSVEEVDNLFLRCNVVIATMPSVMASPDVVRARMAEHSTHLFIDEAHHVPARKWTEFRTFFSNRRLVQFTATPFRRDGRRIEGTPIFNYPLRLAQEEGYFRQITLRGVREYDSERRDASIARAAIEQLRTDQNKGLQHVVMARTDTIERAEEVHALYQREAPEFAPLLVHSHVGRKGTLAALRALRALTSRVVVCVDMLGEGFDLPELKIAALHDVHKSLAITLQFTGRFVRGKPKVGDATIVANIVDPGVEERLEALYAEDADWNILLRRLSEGASARELRRSAVLDGFVDPPTRVRLDSILPKMSTVAYRTTSNTWRPKAVVGLLPSLMGPPSISHKAQLAVFFTKEQEPVSWANVRNVVNTIFDLYLVHWDTDRGLLFIHTSNKEAALDGIARAIVGQQATLIRGEDVFRTLHGINQLLLVNLGLNHSLSRAVRFTMYMGSDIREGLSQASLQTKRKSNVFGRGYEGGERASIGCSAKGRIWSHRIAYDLSEWLEWCHKVGGKLLDAKISVRDILDHVILPKTLSERPALAPITIEWSEHFYTVDEEVVVLEIGDDPTPLVDVGLELTTHAEAGPLRFRVFTESHSVEYECVFGEGEVRYRPVAGHDVILRWRRRAMPLSQWLDREPPVVRFENGAFLIYNNLFEVPREGQPPFDVDRMIAMQWSGVDLRKESQGVGKVADSIQRRMIDELLRSDDGMRYDIVFDDDATHEAADIVALKLSGDELVIDLFHCKFAKDGRIGADLENLYEVCGQAQRSVQWKARHVELLKHLRRRESSRMSALVCPDSSAETCAG